MTSGRTHDPPRRLVFHHLRPVSNYPESKISPYFRVNGYPPTEDYPSARNDEYIQLRNGEFADWTLEVSGRVATPLRLSLDELRALPRREQTTMHHCIQGWTAIGRWTGVAVSDLLDRCQLAPDARYVAFQGSGTALQFDVPANLLHPIGGLDNAVTQVQSTINRLTVKKGGKTRGYYETVGCKGKQRPISVDFLSEAGQSVTATTNAKC